MLCKVTSNLKNLLDNKEKYFLTVLDNAEIVDLSAAVIKFLVMLSLNKMLISELFSLYALLVISPS